MIEVALLLSLAALGYIIASDSPTGLLSKNPRETFVSPMPTSQDNDTVVNEVAQTGHNNMVPSFGARVTQSMYSGATDGMLDAFTGQGASTFFHKEEAPAFFKPESATGQPFGMQNESDFMQARMVSSMRMANVFPIEQTQVGPGVNDGYTNLPSGGYQQFTALQEYTLPKTTDEIRVANKQKLTYDGVVVPGAAPITQPGLQAPVKKNRPDRFGITGMDRVNTAVGQQVAGAIYPEVLMKEQSRETTSVYYNSAAQAAAGGFSSYIRAFTEPYEEFMKLTAEGRANPGSSQIGGIPAGQQSYNVAVHKDETVLNNTRGFEAPLFAATPAHGAQMGSVRYNIPLKQDVNMERNGGDILEAYRNNPFTKSLSSSP
jgi:hypothetical protein